MGPTITLEGIDNAIAQLNYRSAASIKYRVLQAVRSYYVSADSVSGLGEIDTDELIKQVWDTGDDPDLIRSKRRNLNSVKSTINTDLDKLTEKDLNPEGITIGPSNTFTMSDAARDKLLSSFTDAVRGSEGITLDRVTDVLSVINDFLSSMDNLSDESGFDLDRIRKILEGLTREMDRDDQEPPPEDSEEEVVEEEIIDEEIEDADPLDEDEELEIIEEEIDEFDEDVEIVDEDEEDFEDMEVLDEDEDDFEDVEVLDEDEDDFEDVEVLDEDEDDFEDVEVLDEDEDDFEDVEVLDEDEDDFEDVEVLDEDEDDFEDVEVLDEDEDDFEDVEVLDEDEDDFEDVEVLDEDEDDFEDVEVLDEDEDDFEDVEVLDEDDEDVELLDEDELEDVEVLEDDEIEDVDDSVLAEDFDEYLGSLERQYNEYLLIPGGSFTVGAARPDRNELPERIVTLSDFYMGKYPVTNALFEVFVQKTGYVTTAEILGYGTVYQGRYRKVVDKKTGLVQSVWNSTSTEKSVQGACWYQPTGPGSTLHTRKHHPVVQVSFKDAASFAAWVGKRLPTEFEWESGARTQSGNIFPWGNKFETTACNIESSAVADTTPVDNNPGSMNEYGILDTLGNIFEWTGDEDYPPFSPDRKTKYRIAKGGSWNSSNDIRLSSRFFFKTDFTSNLIGFRCVIE